ncbi:MAG: hypothetical protein DRQ59_15000 [Gammaproteobacteria bacterium]|nr:MAG: hypothetical protein DRQ59_15000 [Gammaproteobacteria bacterium]
MKLNKSLIKTKLKASGIHLSLSLVIFFVLAYQIYYVWYPVPYFSVDGGWQGIRLIAAVDLVLGPLITFLIFDLRKSRRAIIFDLVVIAVVQISALIFGINTTYQQRPVAVVLIDQFMVGTIESSYGSQLESLDELNQFSPETPPIIFADLLQTREALDEVLRIKFEDGVTESAQVHLYQSPAMLQKGLQERQSNYLPLLEKFGASERMKQWLQTNQKQQEDVLIAPFNGRYGLIWLIFDAEATYLDYL